MERKQQQKKDLLWIGVLLLIAVGMLLWRYAAGQTARSKALVALISVQGEVIAKVDLTPGREPYLIEMQKLIGIPVSFSVEGNRIRYVNVTCPDHICEKTGYVQGTTDIAICMPNRTILSVVTKQEAENIAAAYQFS